MDGKKRLEVSHEKELRYPCNEVFELFCPVREDDWIPGWAEQRTIVYTESGRAELGCVFLTAGQPHLMGHAIWVNNIYKPFEEIQYSAVNNHLVYQIHLDFKKQPAGCIVTLRRTWTALTSESEKFLGSLAIESQSQHKPPNLFEMADYYLSTGKMISVSSI